MPEEEEEEEEEEERRPWERTTRIYRWFGCERKGTSRSRAVPSTATNFDAMAFWSPSSAATTSFLPVFMDCWYREEGAESPQSVLYYVPRGASSGREGEPPRGSAIGGMRIISRPFDSSGSAVDHKRLRAELLAGVESGQRSNQGREKDERNFQKERERREGGRRTARRPPQQSSPRSCPSKITSRREGRAPEGCTRVVEVNPQGGTLVLFDSVTVPHEVTAVLAAAAPLEASDEPSGSSSEGRLIFLPLLNQTASLSLDGFMRASSHSKDLGMPSARGIRRA